MSPPPELPPPELLPPELPAPELPPLLEPPVVAALVAGVIVICAVPERAVSAADTAVTVTADGEGTAAGAVYIPELEIVPTLALPPATPFTCHVTAVLEEFVTVTDNI